MMLYGYFRSSAAFRVRIALNLKGIAYEQSSIHLRKNEQRKDDYLSLNPQGLVPTLDDAWVLLRLPETLHPEYRLTLTGDHIVSAAGLVPASGRAATRSAKWPGLLTFTGLIGDWPCLALTMNKVES